MVRLGRRSGSLAAALGAALAVTLAATPPAGAISSKRATKVALKALAPQKKPGPVVVYRLAKKLGAGQTVLDNGIGAIPASRAGGKSATVTVAKLKRPVWLFWADLLPGAKFEHPGRLVLVDDRSGRVARAKGTTWWPIVNGKNPAFIPTSGAPRRLIAYSSAPRTARRTAAPRQDAAPALGGDAFANDCMYQLGFGEFAADLPAMEGALSPFGLRTFTTGSHKDLTGQDIVDADGADMRTAIKALPEDCRDVLIYVSGHGAQDGEPRVQVGYRYRGAGADPPAAGKTYKVISRYVYAQDLVGIAEDNPQRTFKIKIDACYAGRFIPALELDEHANILVVEGSSSATETSWGDLGASVRVRNGKIVKTGGTVVRRKFTNAGRSEFTNGNMLAIQRFTASQTEVDAARAKGGSLLARMLERALELGKDADLAATAGLTHPQMATNLPAEPAQPTPAAPFALSVQSGHNHTAFDATHPSRVCGKVATSPAQPGAVVHVVITDDDAGGATIYEADVTLGADGTKTFEAGITHYGRYTMTVTAAGSSGAATSTVNVTAAEGTCPS